MVKAVRRTVYEAADGRVFDTFDEAKKHEIRKALVHMIECDMILTTKQPDQIADFIERCWNELQLIMSKPVSHQHDPSSD